MSSFQVRVHALDHEAAARVASLQLFADLGLRDVTAVTSFLQENAPCLLVAGVHEEVADRIVETMTAVGVSAEKELSPSNVPMLLCPEANQLSRWARPMDRL